MSKAAIDAGSPARGTHFGTIALSLLCESPHNPRKHFPAAELAELAQSIRQKGIITPLVVRRAGRQFEIAAGHRRYRAAQQAGLTEVPVVIREMTDAEFLEVLTIENLQRQDIHPLEEAEGFRQLLELEGYTADLLAEKVSRKVAYVYKRLQLTKLIEPLKGKFLKGEIQIGHAVLLCRLSERDQIAAAKQALFERRWDEQRPQLVSARRLEDWIRREVYLDLSAAAWKKDDAELVPAAGSCASCPKRSGANVQLFDDLPKGDICLDSACFAGKQEALLVAIATAAEAEGTPLIRVATGYLDSREEKKFAAIGSSNYTKIESKKDRCGDVERALVVAGRSQIGQVIDICRNGGCKIHHGGSLRPSRSASFADVWKEKRRRVEETIKLEARRELIRQVMAKSSKLGITELRVLASAMVKDYLRHDGRKEFSATLRLEVKHAEIEKALLAAIPQDGKIAGFLMAVCCLSPYGQSFGGGTTEANAIAKAVGVNSAAVTKRIAKPLLEKFAKAKSVALKKIAADTKNKKPARKPAAGGK